MSPAPRILAVCADDFGESRALSEVVAALASRGRLTAVSCLSSGAAWRESAPLLAGLRAEVLRGLHFNLTAGRPVSPDLRRLWPEGAGLLQLLLLAGVRALPLQAIAVEWRAQWDAFVDAVGRAPDFIDGHQHVHHLPGVRELILSRLRPGVAVRSTGRPQGPGFAFKREVIAVTGGRRLATLLEAQGRLHNEVLVGIYNYRRPDYRALVRGWLQVLPSRGALLFCHPGDGVDAMGPARRWEAQYLGSPHFLEDLAGAGISLGPAWPQSSSAG